MRRVACGAGAGEGKAWVEECGGVRTERKGGRRGGHTLLFYILGTVDNSGWIILGVGGCLCMVGF